MIRFGLCCQFADAPIRFRAATHRYVSTLDAAERRAYLSSIARDNASALAQAIERCHALGIGAFRITSQILPLATHPESGYTLATLDDGDAIARAYVDARDLARSRDVRLSFHPDQFVVLNSERESVRESSRNELEFQASVATLVGADTITLHVGGAGGGKPAALDRLERAIDGLTDAARSRLALENDDRSFTVADLLPLCTRTRIPLVYDVHHHRCNPDDFTPEEASVRAAATWTDRAPWFHVSSPRDGWTASNPRPHADYIDPADVPAIWRDMDITLDVEAKAKELAVVRLMADLRGEDRTA